MSSEFRHRVPFILNVILAVTAVALALHRSEPAPAAPVEMTNEAPVETPLVISQPQSPKYPGVASATDRRRWLIDQLRAMGVPNEVLARVVMADLDKGWNKRGAEIAIKFHGDSDKMAALQLEIDRSKDAEMRAALGEDGFRQWDQGNMLREVNQDKIQLTATETDQAYNLWKKVQQRQLDLEQAKVEGTMDSADINEATDKSASDFNQQMKALLGDDRYAKSQQPDDGSAALQPDLAQANPSDSQFQELLKAQQQLNDQRAALDKQFQDNPSSPDYAAQLKALNDARDQEYQRVLGTNAFDTLQKQQDPGYNQMKQYETLWGLDDNKINSTYAAIQYYQKSVQDYQSQASALQAQGQQVDWDAVNKNLQQFADQTQEALQNYVGQDTFDKMQRNGVFQLGLPALTGHNGQSKH
jgi:hypothetical protein